MNYLNTDLLRVRLLAFLYQAGTFVGIAIIGSLLSDDFRAIVAAHAGDGTTGFLILSVFDAVVKQLRNVSVLSKANDLGAIGETRKVILI